MDLRNIISGSPQDEQQFWYELEKTVMISCETQADIDEALKTYLKLIANFGQYLPTEYEWDKCSWFFLEAPLFRTHKSYLRKRIIGRLRKDSSNPRLHLFANILLFDGRDRKATFEYMLEDNLFGRLVELVRTKRDEDWLLWRVVLDLMYEMSRMQRLRPQDFLSINDDFVHYLFGLVEEDPYDHEDPYHYPIIRMLLVLNEQYMLSPSPSGGKCMDVPTNKVIKVLSFHGTRYPRFGENIVLLINRENETSLQLLILKVLYLIFTTTATYEYFYSNDLRVLVDVIIRNLLDLPEEAGSLRHTYLRVLYPLLTHSQLSQAPYYKRTEILRMLDTLSNTGSTHFEPADPTTMRLVSRCLSVPWLKTDPEENGVVEKPEKLAHRFLGITLSQKDGESNVSLIEVAAQNEKPGVITPSRSRANSKVNQKALQITQTV
ncbi:hypothetical protein EX30DRAFT_26354 [Ascodesmis nigricans]|uniref:SPIN90/Ldb17 leucine-rich domain-containing protein n=1 Tax=Ascodesmis nigricans TaxID=341454 RepID=A0A4S2N8B0_9PEZI|nr:hypothetical protein EX30DRAFT_26354 [Ascodesmis nigricans]